MNRLGTLTINPYNPRNSFGVGVDRVQAGALMVGVGLSCVGTN